MNKIMSSLIAATIIGAFSMSAMASDSPDSAMSVAEKPAAAPKKHTTHKATKKHVAKSAAKKSDTAEPGMK
ncbi:MAG TPA: hypothetical protein VMV78_04425 [Thiobacillus sp.]|nr:hypothetical protein [Thiobacillus sp.]